MAKISPQDAAQEWADTLSARTTKMQRGIEAVTTAPTAKAALASDKYLAGVQRSVANKKYQNALNRVSLQDWQKAAIEKGLPRVASGAQAAKGKMADFFGQLFPYQDQLGSTVRAMRSNTKDDTKARMNAWFDGMVKFQKK